MLATSPPQQVEALSCEASQVNITLTNLTFLAPPAGATGIISYTPLQVWREQAGLVRLLRPAQRRLVIADRLEAGDLIKQFGVPTTLRVPDIWTQSGKTDEPMCGLHGHWRLTGLAHCGPNEVPSLIMLTPTRSDPGIQTEPEDPTPALWSELLFAGFNSLIGGTSVLQVEDLAWNDTKAGWGSLVRLHDTGCLAGHRVRLSVLNVSRMSKCDRESAVRHLVDVHTTAGLELVMSAVAGCGGVAATLGTLRWDTKPSIACAMRPVVDSAYSRMAESLRGLWAIPSADSLNMPPVACIAHTRWCQMWQPAVTIELRTVKLVVGNVPAVRDESDVAIFAGISVTWMQNGPASTEDDSRINSAMANINITIDPEAPQQVATACVHIEGNSLQLVDATVVACAQGVIADVVVVRISNLVLLQSSLQIGDRATRVSVEGISAIDCAFMQPCVQMQSPHGSVSATNLTVKLSSGTRAVDMEAVSILMSDLSVINAGGIRIRGEESVALSNVHTEDCTWDGDGGCGWVRGAEVRIVHSTFHHCSSTGHGGGLYVMAFTQLQLVDSWLGLSASHKMGGALGVNEAMTPRRIVIRDSVFWANRAIQGGGIYVAPRSRQAVDVVVEMRQNVMHDCWAQETGGGILVSGVGSTASVFLQQHQCAGVGGGAGFSGGGIGATAAHVHVVDGSWVNQTLGYNVWQSFIAVTPTSREQFETRGFVLLADEAKAGAAIDVRDLESVLRLDLNNPSWWQPKSIAAANETTILAPERLGCPRGLALDVRGLLLEAASATAVAVHMGGQAVGLVSAGCVNIESLHSSTLLDADATSFAVVVSGTALQRAYVDIASSAASGQGLLRCIGCADIQVSGSEAISGTLLLTREAQYVSIQHSTARGAPTMVAALQAQRGPVMVEGLYAEMNAGGLDVACTADSSIAWQAINGPIAVTMDRSVVTGVRQDSVGFIGGGLRVILWIPPTVQAQNRGQQVILTRSLLTNNRVLHGHGGAVAIATRYNIGSQQLVGPQGPIDRVGLNLIQTKVSNNSVSPEFGRGADIFVHGEVKLTRSKPKLLDSNANCPIGLRRLQTLLDGQMPDGHSCRRAYNPGQDGLYTVGVDCTFGWEPRETQQSGLNNAPRSSSADIQSADPQAMQLLCRPCDQGWHPVWVKSAPRCVLCPPNMECRGMGHVMPMTGYWTPRIGLVRDLTALSGYPVRARCGESGIGQAECVGYSQSVPCGLQGEHTAVFSLVSTAGATILHGAGQLSVSCLSQISSESWNQNITADSANATLPHTVAWLPPTTSMMQVWTALQRCNNEHSIEVFVPLSDVDGLSTGVCSAAPLHLPIATGGIGLSPYAAYLEGGVSVEQYGDRSGEWAGWLLPYGCEVGYEGPLCQACAAGHGRVGTFRTSCKPCSAETTVALKQIGTMAVVMTVVLFLTYRTLASNTETGAKVAIERIALNHLQALGLLAYIDVECEQVASTVVGWIATVAGGSSTASDIGCLHRPAAEQHVLRPPAALFEAAWTFGSAVMVIGMWVLGGVVYYLLRSRKKSQEAQSHDSDVCLVRSKQIPGALAVMSLMYPAVWKAMLSLLSCTTLYRRGAVVESNPELYDGSVSSSVVDRVTGELQAGLWQESLLEADMSWKCWTGDHLVWVLVWGMPVGLGYIVALLLGWWHALRPLSLAVARTRRSGRRQAPTNAAEQAHRAAYGFMYQGYAVNRWYWELVHMLLVLVQLLGMVLLNGSGAGVAAGWAIVVSLVRLCTSVVWHPYGGTGGTTHMLHALDILSCCGLVGSGMAFVYMVGASTNAGPAGGSQRALACSKVGWLGTSSVLGLEVCVLGCILFAYVHVIRTDKKK